MAKSCWILLSLLLTVTGSMLAQAHVSGNNSGTSPAFCDSRCQNEVIDTLSQKISRQNAESLLALGITLARDDREWQELIGRVQTAICNEKKTGSVGSDDAALQREILLRISHEQKEMAELQDKALRTGSPADREELKQRSAKLVVIGVGVKRMASGSSCSTN